MSTSASVVRMENPSNRMQECREAAGLQLTEIAAACRVSENTVRRRERGISETPDRDKLITAKLCGVTVEHLMGWDRHETGAAA